MPTEEACMTMQRQLDTIANKQEYYAEQSRKRVEQLCDDTRERFDKLEEKVDRLKLQAARDEAKDEATTKLYAKMGAIFMACVVSLGVFLNLLSNGHFKKFFD